MSHSLYFTKPSAIYLSLCLWLALFLMSRLLYNSYWASVRWLFLGFSSLTGFSTLIIMCSATIFFKMFCLYLFCFFDQCVYSFPRIWIFFYHFSLPSHTMLYSGPQITHMLYQFICLMCLFFSLCFSLCYSLDSFYG